MEHALIVAPGGTVKCLRTKSSILSSTKPELASRPTTPEEIVAQKQAVRDAMSFARSERIQQYAEFVERMLFPTSNGMVKNSVKDLIANGEELAFDLKKAARARSGTRQLELLQTSIQPYLQLITENDRCEFTGHRLSDIWRFFRFTWANPPETTPGRTLLYLVRDAARPHHPVMSIFSLENSALRIACRDHHLGWTPESFVAGLGSAQSNRVVTDRLRFLLASLDRGIEGIELRGLCRRRDVESPTENAVLKLAEIARKSDGERMLAVKDWQDRAGDSEFYEFEQSELGNISLTAEEALYRRKRAEQLSRLLSAKLRIHSLLSSCRLSDELPTFVESDAGMTAIRTALIANKNMHVGTSILELNVCGAVPPYNNLLSGKLAALLAISPRVVSDYRSRYGERPSDIASRMKGSPVVRPAELVFVGTSSLYAGGSSQYNRLRIPKAVFGSEEDVVWRQLGETKGYGTLHIGRETLGALAGARTLLLPADSYCST